MREKRKLARSAGDCNALTTCGAIATAFGTAIAFDPPQRINMRGYIGHLLFAVKLLPDCDEPPTAIMQWCLPSRRQHAGRLESCSDANTGLSSEKLKRTSNRMAEKRRKRSC
jgi:hypothetical protein